MMEWWEGLDALTQGFYIASAFFSLLFIWQFIAALAGLSAGDEGLDAADADVDADVDAVDAAESLTSFKLLSFRSAIAFCTLFSWGGALYLDQGVPVGTALFYAFLWGMLAMVVVAALFYLFRRLVETGTQKLSSCVRESGMTYLDIPADGTGEVKVTVSGTLTHVPARSADGSRIKTGTPVRVTRVLGKNLIEVEPESGPGETKG